MGTDDRKVQQSKLKPVMPPAEPETAVLLLDGVSGHCEGLAGVGGRGRSRDERAQPINAACSFNHYHCFITFWVVNSCLLPKPTI